MKTFDNFETLLEKIKTLSENSEKNHFLIAIDGKSASGKTTLAANLEKSIFATVFHVDDYFLQSHQRTSERFSEPGGNFDRERFLQEILTPLSENQKIINYRKFSCKSMSLQEMQKVEAKKIVIVEGAYSLHPNLQKFYDLKIFLDISKQDQMQRILRRNGEEKAKQFAERWIPMEEKYFSAFKIKEIADLILFFNENGILFLETSV